MASGSEKAGTTLNSAFATVPPDSHFSVWKDLWTKQFTPWDRGGPSMALHDLLVQHVSLLPETLRPGSNARVLVPGCGRGHDAIFLSYLGYQVYALDLSEKAINEARQNEAAVAEDGAYIGKKLSFPVTAVAWINGDFFSDDWRKENGFDTADLIFDYTFACAFPPSMRPKWARRTIQLLTLPAGRLICLEFPSAKPPSARGPPWAMPPHIYEAHLNNPDAEDLPKDPHGHVLPGAYVNSDPAKDGLLRVVHLKPDRTHCESTGGSMSTDGRVLDWISVWRHFGAEIIEK